MTILFLSPGLFDKGGISRYGRYQVRAIRERIGGEAVHAMSLAGAMPGDFEEPLRVAWRGPGPYTAAARARFVLAASMAVATRGVDVVLTGHVNLGPLGLALARVRSARFVQTIYGIEVWSGLTPARRAALRRADRVISDCHHTVRRAVELDLLPRRADVVWDCVDVERYTPGQPDRDALARYDAARDDRFRILFLGRIAQDARYKGTERLLRLLALLPPDRFEAVFAGKGDDVAHLRAAAAARGLEGRVRFAGAVHEDDMVHVYRSADAFYLTSEVGPAKGEGLPLTPIEAMACGVPVVLGNEDGSAEILDDRGGGWLGHPEDLKGQSEYLRGLDAAAGRLAAERGAARLRATSAFGFERFAAETERVLVPKGQG